MEVFEPRRYLAADVAVTGAPLQNLLDPYDVNGDQLVSVADLLCVVQALREGDGGAAAAASGKLPDVNGDGQVTPADLVATVARLAALRQLDQDATDDDAGDGSGGDAFGDDDFVFSLHGEGSGGGGGGGGGGGSGSGGGGCTGSVDISDAGAEEEDGTITFTVQFSGSCPDGFTVDFHTEDDTAVGAGSGVGEPDYTPITDGQISFAGTDGETADIDVSITDDNVVELDETFTVVIDAIHDGNGVPVGVTATNTAATGTILNVESAEVNVVAAFAGNSLDEGTSTQQATDASFTITLSKKVDVPVTVWFETQDGTAIGASAYPATWDYFSINGFQPQYRSRTFPAGSTISQVITIAINPDSVVEADEDFTLNASQVEASGRSVDFVAGAESNSVTILDDDQAVITISPPAGPIDESSNQVFTLSLSNSVDVDVDVTLQTIDGNGKAGSDFSALVNPTLTFPAYTTNLSQNVTITVNDDNIVEQAEEDFDVDFVSVSAPGRAVSGSGSATGQIQDNDTANVTVDDASVTEGDSGLTPLPFTVHFSKPVDVPITITYSTSDPAGVPHLAYGDHDYVSETDTVVVMPALATSTQLLVVDVIGDGYDEYDEQFGVQFTLQPQGGAQRSIVIVDSIAIGTIVNDD